MTARRLQSKHKPSAAGAAATGAPAAGAAAPPPDGMLTSLALPSSMREAIWNKERFPN